MLSLHTFLRHYPTDVDGTPHTIKIDVPENGSYERVFPMLVTDSKGNSYQVSAAEHSTGEGAGDNVGSDSKKKRIQLTCERVDRIGDFNTESLSSKYGYIHFKPGEGKYAFDNGQEKWYKKSVKVDRFYKPVAKGYIAPWKLVPVGENDVVTAKYEGSKNIDLKKVRFASEPNTAALPAKFNEAEQTWTVSLRSVSPGASYDVFAVYEGVAIGKLRVVSCAKYIVPAVFLQYYNDKLFNDKVEKNSLLAVDIATIALSGGTALATKVHLARRLWAMAEVAGAVGNIAINTRMISIPKVKEVVEIYNAAMGLIGLKNLGQGGYKFVKELPEPLNQSLKNQLVSKYLDYRIAITKLKNSNDWAELSAEIRQNIIKQEKSFIAFADAKNIPNDKWGAPDNIFINGKTKQDILSIKKGERPVPDTYLSTRYIKEHLAKFENGAVRIISRKKLNKYGTLGPDGGFVFSKDYLDDVVKEAKGNMRVIEQKLGLEFGFLNDNDVMIVLIKKEDFINPRFPTGNKIGVNNLWIPGGLTSGGIPELVMDFSLSPKFSEIKIH